MANRPFRVTIYLIMPLRLLRLALHKTAVYSSGKIEQISVDVDCLQFHQKSRLLKDQFFLKVEQLKQKINNTKNWNDLYGIGDQIKDLSYELDDRILDLEDGEATVGQKASKEPTFKQLLKSIADTISYSTVAELDAAQRELEALAEAAEKKMIKLNPKGE